MVVLRSEDPENGYTTSVDLKHNPPLCVVQTHLITSSLELSFMLEQLPALRCVAMANRLLPIHSHG